MLCIITNDMTWILQEFLLLCFGRDPSEAKNQEHAVYM